MKFSESWLRTFVNPALSSGELSHLLTMAGLEVEAQDPVAPAFDGVVVAKVLSVTKHPDADRLNVCQVEVGNAGDGALRQIVCGAPNVAAGLIVPCALPGATLPGGFKIRLAKVRGVESAGMLCSAKELGIAEEADGLLVLSADAPVGENLRHALDLDDQLFTLKLTPNRADCLSLTGIAREVAALTGSPARFPAIAPAPVNSAASRFVALDAPAACPRYCGRVIEGVNARAATPQWLRQRLERSGLRSISALVDVTNYVLLELGQPLHAFDNAKLSPSSPIRARLAKPGETLTLLNEQTVELAADVLVIADDRAALAMAGIMGGAASGVTLDSTEIFLESAFFAPKTIAGRARRYNFSSDASHRYERGVDFANCLNALERATTLILEICGGAAGPVTESVAELPARPPVRLRVARTQKVLGVPLTAPQIADLLRRLALPFVEEDTAFWVTPPSYRFDLEIEADLIEEVARLHGYDQIPAAAVEGRLTLLTQGEDQRPLCKVRQQMADRGFQEVINFAFVPEAWETDFAANHAPIRLANPIASQLAVMRSGLIGGLVEAIATNLKRQQSRVRLFEQGRCFLREKTPGNASLTAGYQQPVRLAALAYGAADPEGWGHDGRKVDFFDLKGDLEALLAPAELTFARVHHPALHPGRAASVHLAGKGIGVIGELHPQWAQKYDLPAPPVLFEITLEAAAQSRLPAYTEVSRFQSAIRDRAFVVDRELPLQTVLAAMKKCAPARVSSIELFDLYQGKGVPAGKKSLAFRIVMQDTERTLLDVEIDAIVAEITAYLEQTLAAQLRA
ncbi:MAG: phenylalanine--tRNA ligase subunit beta [Zoogloeaceae bacterium]|jgi:phenylalanyl-tRNA synthetase beta chain|nr:phenylalanine--tRNA ligase subunit beta [Zoogloeaceae bacterium]